VIERGRSVAACASSRRSLDRPVVRREDGTHQLLQNEVTPRGKKRCEVQEERNADEFVSSRKAGETGREKCGEDAPDIEAPILRASPAEPRIRDAPSLISSPCGHVDDDHDAEGERKKDGEKNEKREDDKAERKGER